MKIRAALAAICLSYFSEPLMARMHIGRDKCSSSGTATIWSDAYSLQANCSGTLSLTNGDTASLSLQSFNGGKNYIVTGQDGIFVYIQISNI